MRYKLLKEENDFLVREETTEQVIDSFGDYTEARWYCKFLNLGGAFDGWTPSFVLKKINLDALENGAESYK
jgi:hypothetical protein